MSTFNSPLSYDNLLAKVDEHLKKYAAQLTSPTFRNPSYNFIDEPKM